MWSYTANFLKVHYHAKCNWYSTKVGEFSNSCNSTSTTAKFSLGMTFPGSTPFSRSALSATLPPCLHWVPPLLLLNLFSSVWFLCRSAYIIELNTTVGITVITAKFINWNVGYNSLITTPYPEHPTLLLSSPKFLSFISGGSINPCYLSWSKPDLKYPLYLFVFPHTDLVADKINHCLKH